MTLTPTTSPVPADLAALCPQTVSRLIDHALAIGPDVEAVVAPDGRMTYAELAAEVARTRAALAAMGVTRGDHVGLCLGNSCRWLVLFLAIGTLGATTVPINTRFRADEIGYVLGQAKIRHLFVAETVLSANLLDMLAEIAPEVETALPAAAFPELRSVTVTEGRCPAGATGWDAFLSRGTPAEPVDRPDDILLIQYTSGTTSFPKGVLLPQSNMLTNAFVVGQRMGLRPADRYHSARPFFHVAGTTLSILAAMHATATLVTMTRFEASEALRLLEEERCTHISGNDTMVLMLLNSPDRARRTLYLRGGWAAATPSVMSRVIHDLGAREAVTTYGMSETSPNISVSCWWEPEEVRCRSLMRVQPGLEVEIRDVETGAVLPRGTAGEIVVRGYSVMRGYFDKPKETAEVLDSEGWMRTGDVGRLDTEGRLEFVGRAKDILRVGGENVSPAEVEDVLHRHPAIRHAQVVGVPDPRLVEVVAAIVVLNDGQTLDETAFLDWARGQIAGFKAPRYVKVVPGFEEIGMTASSKVKRKELAAFAARAFGLA